jgi:multisubunit Na+/H+ antiporter MnhB subunit
MSEEIKNEEEKVVETPAAAADVPAEKPAETTAAEPAQPAVSETQPQIIVQKERGFSHYVGFALLCVLCIVFYFIPGIAISFAINQIPGVALGAVAAWALSAIFSVIAWFIFKLKIKGFKKSFYFYIVLCVVVFALLIAIEVLTENYNVFSSIFGMLMGAE